jgi:hypothetical protein
MSKILRRPMFRGGPVDSRGTGITSGLYAAGGAVKTPKRGIVDGPGSYSYRNFTIGKDLLNLDSAMGQGGQFDILNMKDYLGTSRNILDQQKEQKIGSDQDTILKTTEDIFTEQQEKEDADKAKAKEMGVDVDTMKAIEKENLSSQSIKDSELEKMLANQPDLSKSNNEIKTEMSAKDLIRENAELFKELLGEDNKKKLRDARISDASDYLLKFFEGSQKEGATVGSSAADVAAFATAKPSKTEAAKASIEKGDQTATALAINDYIAGKRSKEATDQLITKLGLSAELKKGNVKEQIRDATVKLGGSPPLSVLQSILAADGPVEVITKEQVEAGYEPAKDGSDDGKYYLEEDTKTIYKVVNSKKVRI